jgi:hypothetical protein
LARFAEARQPELRPLPEPAQLELAGFMSRRWPLSDIIGMEENRRHPAVPKRRQKIDRNLISLKQLSDELNRELNDFSPQHPLLLERTEILLGVPCIGPDGVPRLPSKTMSQCDINVTIY